MGDAGICRPVLSPVSLTASAEGRKAATFREATQEDMSPALTGQDTQPGRLPPA